TVKRISRSSAFCTSVLSAFVILCCFIETVYKRTLQLLTLRSHFSTILRLLGLLRTPSTRAVANAGRLTMLYDRRASRHIWVSAPYSSTLHRHL
uniref:Uncharacterized protein n=1 Tax=Anopheles atroparvus TaxID=41427 RepID=A0AAG5D0S1_ANOAO